MSWSTGISLSEAEQRRLSFLAEHYESASVVILDHGNYPFLRCTATWLRQLGMDVRYVFNSGIQAPHQSSSSSSEDKSNEIGVGVNGKFKKYSFGQRWYQEREWASNCVDYLESRRPTIVFSANTPLEAQKRIAKWCRRNGIFFVFWLQDIQGLAIYKLLGRKWPVLGHAIGLYYSNVERHLLRQSNHVILIAEEHLAVARRYRLESSRLSVLANWALVAEYPI